MAPLGSNHTPLRVAPGRLHVLREQFDLGVGGQNECSLVIGHGGLGEDDGKAVIGA